MKQLSMNDRYRKLWLDVIIRAIKDYKLIGDCGTTRDQNRAKEFLKKQSTWDLAGIEVSASQVMRELDAESREEIKRRLLNLKKNDENEEENELA